ncbi:MAG: ferritin [Nitrospirae bacterium GWC2_46_6]|nr:MAG: ferritin [Nitrospirae bacterium GWC2_46_6]OGW19820.1 MAG: ferritin [Nitrospirae bacterium GWA2_46_11]OGW24517.1 MAG: ferritin [Nitrospirae bacterium GWB2_47_37]HAK88687.1 ferritin [Nitrospiraceae bacterium]HCL81089.1 ferritin [Nitrospiraceae bacterium]
MASKKLLEQLNEAIAREMQVSIQYMWQHIMIRGINAQAIGPVFRLTAIAEMMHAELIAERLDYLGGVPTTKPAPINVGKTAKDMLTIDKKAEEEAIAMYKGIIKLAEKEEDYTTKKLFEQILADEENHHNTFRTLLEG